jgi:hypothetical protein
VTDPIATVSPVASLSATTHSFWSETVTDTEPMRSVIEVSALYYLISSSGASRVEVVP